MLRLASQSGKKEGHAIRIDFPVSKQDIAEMAGTTLHTVSRILTAWEAADLVEGGRQKLLIKNPHRLLLIGDGEAPACSDRALDRRRDPSVGTRQWDIVVLACILQRAVPGKRTAERTSSSN